MAETQDDSERNQISHECRLFAEALPSFFYRVAGQRLHEIFIRVVDAWTEQFKRRVKAEAERGAARAVVADLLEHRESDASRIESLENSLIVAADALRKVSETNEGNIALAKSSHADAARYSEAYRKLNAEAVAGIDRERALEADRDAWRQQCDELSEQVASLVRENAEPQRAAFETMGGMLQKIVACAGGKIELDADAVRSCNAAFLASIPTLAGGLILVNAVKPEQVKT